MDGRKEIEYEMKETITSLEYWLMDALSKIETMSARIKEFEKGMEKRIYATLSGDKEARIEAPKRLMFKGASNAPEVENFLWHWENHFNCNKVKNNKTKINMTMLYLLEMANLWWKRKDSKIWKGLCNIDT